MEGGLGRKAKNRGNGSGAAKVMEKWINEELTRARSFGEK